MASLLLGILFWVLFYGFSNKLEEQSCNSVPYSGSGKAFVLFGGKLLLLTCGNLQRLSYCSKGNWKPHITCPEEQEETEAAKGGLSHPMSTNRAKRNTGKYQELRRRVKVQRQIRAGLLETTIDTTTPTIYRAHPGGNVYLGCRVENLGGHSVTWIRKKDNIVLAIDTAVLHQDRRLYPTYEEKTETWLLGILGARERDDGQYECRVTTRPPLQRIVTLELVPSHEPLHGPVKEDDHGSDHDFLMKNLTAVWEELQDLRMEINHHVHEGHEELSHDQSTFPTLRCMGILVGSSFSSITFIMMINVIMGQFLDSFIIDIVANFTVVLLLL
ncbi:hypothetical protein SK128_001575 [Halocaridina rubra]|uniref:Ig-like domain-containing protein n=1 Tax=Halocaridina rubra TaxID=373956 RepID=A0AAN8XII7_HALRR